MKASELMEQLRQFITLNDPVVKVKVNGVWLNVAGVDFTGEHRNAIELKLEHQGRSHEAVSPRTMS